jgi:predicted transcriptional regulator
MPSFLVLDIRKEPAERIFAGTKKYEFRKVLPTTPFSVVFLYRQEEGGLIGCFHVSSVIRDTITALWNRFGTHATSKARFDEYFNGWENGCAIELYDPVRFLKTYNSDELCMAASSFVSPKSHLDVQKGHQFYNFLFSIYNAEVKGTISSE